MTAKLKTLKNKIKKKKKMGFSEIASAKARGLIKRADGTKRKSKKYGGKNGKKSSWSTKRLSLDEVW